METIGRVQGEGKGFLVVFQAPTALWQANHEGLNPTVDRTLETPRPEHPNALVCSTLHQDPHVHSCVYIYMGLSSI